MAPTPDQYQVALTALRDDADKWDQCGNDLATAKGSAESLDLEALHFSYVGDKLGVTALYQQFQARMVALLSEGNAMSTRVATALRNSAQTYQQEEEAGVHRMNNVW
ncbi:hypothetical protein [Actinophytocola sp.]|jgi:hypothetical protein|uniref:hypothetical protein n=1 Tax=Actinophytocola sp. TaxID=1872138 RepID=UPI002ED834AE